MAKEEKKKHVVNKNQVVNGHDLYVAAQLEKLISLLNVEKNKRVLSDHQVSGVYPMSNFVANNVKNVLEKRNGSIASFIKTAYALGYEIELKKIT